MTRDTLHVLFVDDESEVRELGAEMLERADGSLTVATCRSAGAGLEELSETTFDCVVSDYQMPGMNGLAFYEAVSDARPELPFVLYTGVDDRTVFERAADRGIDACVRKRVGTEQYHALARRIRDATGMRLHVEDA